MPPIAIVRCPRGRVHRCVHAIYTFHRIVAAPTFLHDPMLLGDFLCLWRFKMENNTLRELYVDELRDIYDAEKQLIKALPKMAEAATSEDLRTGFEEHLEQTKGHAERLEQIFSELGEKPTGKKCKGMQGLVSEGSEMIDEDFEGEVKDAGLISAAQRVEHYEIAAYGTVRTYAIDSRRAKRRFPSRKNACGRKRNGSEVDRTCRGH